MTIVAREQSLAKSESEMCAADIATLLASTSRMIEGEVIPNVEAIVAQNEISFAQKRKDLSAVRALLVGADAVAPTLHDIAEKIQAMSALAEMSIDEKCAPVRLPAKPLLEGSLLRDALRRLHYVQKVVEAAAKWINDVSEREPLKRSALFAKTQQTLIRSFRRVIVQTHQAVIIVAKYRDMGDILILREMTLDAHSALSELQEADESVSEKRKSISILTRLVEESKNMPHIARRLVAATAGIAVVIGITFVIIRLNALAPQTPPLSAPATLKDAPPAQTPSQNALQQEQSKAVQGTIKHELPIKSESAAAPTRQVPVVKTDEPNREKASAAIKPAPPVAQTQPKPEAKKLENETSDIKKSEASVAQTKTTAPKPTATNAIASDSKPTRAPAARKATTQTTENAVEPKSGPSKTEGEEHPSFRKEADRPVPKRKTIVIEE